MSHQTGITANAKLKEFLAKCRDGSIRLMKVSIENDLEELNLEDSLGPNGSWEDDYDIMVLDQLEENQPCYIMYRLDSQHEGSYQWIFICWSPDFSPVRQKMLYASTKATLKNEFGGQIKHELFGTVKEDINLKGYLNHTKSAMAPAPLTDREEELKEIRRIEVGTDIGVDTKHQTIQGVAFPISDDAINSLFDMKDEKYSYIQLSIDLDNEKINLEYTKEDINVEDIRKMCPKDHARYHLFAFPHTFEGDFIRPVVFIYSNPGYSCSIKERMLYSSCKSPVVQAIEQKIGIPLVKKIEIDDAEEITEKFMFDEIHPKENVYKQKFSKPKGPPNRGAKRITKPNQDNAL